MEMEETILSAERLLIEYKDRLECLMYKMMCLGDVLNEPVTDAIYTKFISHAQPRIDALKNDIEVITKLKDDLKLANHK